VVENPLAVENGQYLLGDVPQNLVLLEMALSEGDGHMAQQ